MTKFAGLTGSLTKKGLYRQEDDAWAMVRSVPDDSPVWSREVKVDEIEEGDPLDDQG